MIRKTLAAAVAAAFTAASGAVASEKVAPLSYRHVQPYERGKLARP